MSRPVRSCRGYGTPGRGLDGRVGGSQVSLVGAPRHVVVAAPGQRPVVEIGRRIAVVPAEQELPDEPRLVAGIFQVRLEGGGVVQIPGVLVVGVPVVVGVPAGERRRSGRAAQGGVGEPVGEDGALGAEVAHGLGHHVEGVGGPLVVGHEDDEVRLRFISVCAGLRGGRGDGQAGSGEQREQRSETRSSAMVEGHGFLFRGATGKWHSVPAVDSVRGPC